ncbi:hypothetical protein GCK72_016158 [Caenorhabditis remanei]|uniref:protein-tyrosine-phosphatase n=1 Tax=Caenorhabditis remanei TaxID=31234 RepID=A0A6A5GYB4_CAERE|nr:hypothetical protein GCK72_016158 [Caenorhabditis remanei]KAF1759691.1 hypothetical protein GCK72_016158 [Caenorhabditis remanei]
MSESTVRNEDGPPLEDVDSSKNSRQPPPLPATNPVVKAEEVPVGDLIQFESEEERAATIPDGSMPSGTASAVPATAPTEETPSMESALRAFLKEEETLIHGDFQKRFYQVRLEQDKWRMEPDYKTDCALAPQHYARNRYRDILPYDHNRVKLSEDDDNYDGYMNASIIQLPGSTTTFIAAQAPLPATLDEWWKMIDENNVQLIVILCKLVELNKVKCERYWPEKVGEPEMFGEYDLTIEEEKHFDDDEYLLRVLKMENTTTGTTRTVHQLHYREWPDHGCPSGEKQLLNMIDRMETLHSENPGSPILVHCSAGVGRTGTIIAINHIREQMKAETLTNIDIFGLVIALRKQRSSMVQTQDQYQFVHRCIAAYCRRYLGIPEPRLEDLPATQQLPVGSSGNVRLIAPPTPTTSNDQQTIQSIANYQPDPMTASRIEEDENPEQQATSVPDFPEEPPAPMGPEDLGNSAAF